MNNAILIKMEIILTLNRFEHWTLNTQFYTHIWLQYSLQIGNKDGTLANDKVINLDEKCKMWMRKPYNLIMYSILEIK